MVMKTSTKSKARKRVKGKVKLTQRARIAEKNDDTRVARRDAFGETQLKKAPFIINDNGLNMRIKIKHKSR